MSASNLGNDYINEENSPIPIPPAKDGWADMERRLNATPPKVRLPFLQKAAMVAGIVVVSGIAFAITYHTIYHSSINHPPVHVPQQHPPLTDNPSAKTPADEEVLLTDTIPHSHFSLDKYLPAYSGIAGADSIHRAATPIITTYAHPTAGETGVNDHGGEREATADRTVKTEAGDHTRPNTDGTETAANPAAQRAGRGTNVKANVPGTGAGANPVAHRADSRISANPLQTPNTETSTNVKAATKKTKPAAVAKPSARNVPSTTTAHNTSPEKNIADIPVQITGDVIVSQQTPLLLLQSLPLARVNHSALAQRPPESITSHANSTRQRELPEWQLLLQWQVAVPLSGSTYYLSGPNGNNQLYRLMIPGIRAARKWNVHSISLDLTPFTAQTYNDPLIGESSNQNHDSSTNKLKLRLRKEFGASGTILYHRRIFKQWQVATGIQLNYWTQQSSDQQTVYYPRGTNTPSDSSTTVVKENIRRAQWKIPLEVYYDARRWQAGLRVDLPLNINRNDSITSRIKTPLQLQLMLRYKLLPRRK